MIYNSNTIYGKVWKVKPYEKYIDIQLSTSEKDRRTEGEYRYSNWWARAIGHAMNTLKDVKEGDKIVITKSKFSNESYQTPEGEWRTNFKFLIMEAAIGDTPEQHEYSQESSASAPAASNASPAEPW